MKDWKLAKLRHRIFGGYLIPIALSLGATTFVFISARQVIHEADLLQQSNNKFVDLKQLEVEFFRMQKAARGYYLATFLGKDNSFKVEYEGAVNNFDLVSSRLLQNLRELEQRDRLKEINSLKAQIDRSYRRAFALFEQGKPNEGLALWQSEVVGKLEAVEQLTAQFESRQQEILNANLNEQRNALNSLMTVVIGSTVLATLLAISIAQWLTSSIAQKMDRTASAIASSSSEIAATMEEQERIATQQADSVQETSTTIEQLNVSAQHAATQAEVAAAGAHHALTLTQEGSQAVKQSLEGMSKLRQKVEAIAQQILHLNEQATTIGTISRLVSDLATQTNLLALNAAIEAVRAGEQGQGFNVVAGEIRKLAENSKASAQKIQVLVTEIQKAIASTKLVASEGSKTVEEGEQISYQTAEALAGVTDAINSVALSSQQISLSAQQQAIAIRQVVTAMTELNQGAVQTSTGISQTKVGTQRLNEVAQELKEMV